MKNYYTKIGGSKRQKKYDEWVGHKTSELYFQKLPNLPIAMQNKGIWKNKESS